MKRSRLFLLGALAAVTALGATAVSADMRDRSCLMDAEAIHAAPQPLAAFEREARAMTICIVRKTDGNVFTRYIRPGPTDVQFRIMREHLHETMMARPEVAYSLMTPFMKVGTSGRHFIYASTGRYGPDRAAIVPAPPPRLVHF